MITVSRKHLTRAFLWAAVLTWAIALGAKLFDLLVLAGAWGAAPSASLALYPYGPRYPLDPGDFFQPLSALMLLAIAGALVSGWRFGAAYRRWLWLAAGAFFLIWIATPTVFWPMINELWDASRGRIARTDAQLTALVRRWIVFDWLRILAILVGFVSSVRALGMPLPGPATKTSAPPPD